MPLANESLSSGKRFLKQNWQIIYAFVLIVLVPVTIAANTLFVVNRFRTTVDVELQRTALIIGRLFNVASINQLDSPAALQERVEEVAAVIPEIKSMDILAIDGVDFLVVASLYKDGIGRQAHGRQNILAWSENEAIAYLTKSPRSASSDVNLTPDEIRSDKRYWGVVMPIHDAEGELKYLLATKLSLDVIDNLVRSNLFWSYAWLAITMLIVVLILASNTRLFQYALLFKRLKEVDKMKDDFISMASHELRAPITAIKGYTSLFLEDAFGKLEGRSREVMKTTFSIANHLGTLVEDLLDVSRIEQGRMSFEFVLGDVESIIEEVMGHLKYEAEKKTISFEYRKPTEPLPRISLDKSRLKQVIINVCSNAIKYTQSGEIIVTSFVNDANWVEIKVTDTGIGISAEQREKLFTKFYRVKSDETRDIPGTGLGLWITQRIVKVMGGKIFIDSIEKVGTQVSISFPPAERLPLRDAERELAAALANDRAQKMDAIQPTADDQALTKKRKNDKTDNQSKTK
ncbi:MAG: HAMP domain-containing sensor histidine kinase [Patescibacteria group bacterium]